MGQTSLMTGGTNKKLQTAGGKRTLIQVAQCDQGSLFSRILKILGAFATVYSLAISSPVGSVGFPVGLVVPWPANSSHTKYPVTACIGQLDGI